MTFVIVYCCPIQKAENNQRLFSLSLVFVPSSNSTAFLIFHGRENITLQFSVCRMRICKINTLMHSHICYVPMLTNNQRHKHTLCHAYTNICYHPHTYSTSICKHICILTHAYTDYSMLAHICPQSYFCEIT